MSFNFLRLRSLISLNRIAYATQQLAHTAETSERRTRADLMDAHRDAVDHSIAAIRARRSAEAERDTAVALVRRLSARSEAYLRAVRYLSQNWQPIDPAESSATPAQVSTWLDELTQEVETDQAWAQATEADVTAALAQARERAP